MVTPLSEGDSRVPRGTEFPGHRATFGAMLEEFNAAARRSRVEPRTAVYAVAIDRVATVTRMRGMYV